VPRAGAVESVPPLVRARWQQAEAQLFAPLVLQPEVYQRAVVLLAGVLDRLRALGDTTDALLSASTEVADLVSGVADERGTGLGGIDAVQLGMAAFAMREREIGVAQVRRRRLERIQEAREAGESWTVLEESGDPAGDPFAPYLRLEVDVATGRALLVTASPDDDFRGCEHAVQVTRIELDTGALADVDDAAGPEVMADREQRERRVRDLRT
jgi:hypothetical protein